MPRRQVVRRRPHQPLLQLLSIVTSTTARRNKAAIIWEGEPGDTRVLTYQMLHTEVCRFAAALKKLGLKTGDRVAIYMPMIPEAAIAMLACTRLGATHSIVFGGFSAEALRDRINDAEAKVVITADGGWRRGTVVPLKAAVDAALKETPSIEKVVVVKRTGNDVTMQKGRDLWWDEAIAGVPAVCEAGAARQRASALHPLHERHDRKAEGRRAHDRRLSRARVPHDQARLRPQRTPTSTGARPTSAG